MCESHEQLVSLGFTEQLFPAGTHICQIFNDDEERDRSLSQFLASGIADGEHVSCYTCSHNTASITSNLSALGISMQECIDAGQLVMMNTEEAYFSDNEFNPERMLDFMSNHWKNSLSSGYSKVRVIGEMSPTIQCIKGGDRLTEYECRITIMLRDNKITCICQYDARKFDGATIMDILLVHPMMIVRGQVVQNPFFVPPEEFLEKLKRQQAAV